MFSTQTATSWRPDQFVLKLYRQLDTRRMQTHLTLLRLLVGSFLLGCASQVHELTPHRSYQLVRVGQTDLSAWTEPVECYQVPGSSQYWFADSTWIGRDSARTGAGCPLSGVNSIRADTGYFRMSGDTVHLFVRDTTIGVRGWVNSAILRGDTLLFVGNEFDPGDFVYVRHRR